MNKKFTKLCLFLMLIENVNVQAAVDSVPSIPTALVGSISASQEMPITEEVRKQINNLMQKASLDHPDASITYFTDGIYVEIYIRSEFDPKKVGIDDILESLSTQSWISKLKKLQMVDTIFDIRNLKNVLSKTPYLKNLNLITNILYKMGENDLKDLNLALSKLGNLEELTLNFNDFRESKLLQTSINLSFAYMNSERTYLDKMIEKGLKPLGKFISSYQYIISGKDVMTMLLTIKDMKKN